MNQTISHDSLAWLFRIAHGQIEARRRADLELEVSHRSPQASVRAGVG
jgi:hypothetical protein